MYLLVPSAKKAKKQWYFYDNKLTYYLDLGFETPFLNERNETFGKYKISMEWPVVPENKEVLKVLEKKIVETCQKDTGTNVKKIPMGKVGTV